MSARDRVGPPRPDAIISVTLTLATFGDGGWFGVNNPNPAPAGGAALTGAMLSEPVIQILGEGGWATVGSASNYISQMTGHLIGGGAVPNPSSRDIIFTLNEPLTGASGLRVIGSEGGTASNGEASRVFAPARNRNRKTARVSLR